MGRDDNLDARGGGALEPLGNVKTGSCEGYDAEAEA